MHLRVYPFSTFFFTTLVTKTYSKASQLCQDVNIFEFDLLLIPINDILHWTLIVVDVNRRHITYFDSLTFGSHRSHVKHITDFLTLHYVHRFGSRKALVKQDWSSRYASDITKQQNSNDCGVFTCLYSEFAIGLQKLPVWNDITAERKRIALCIRNARINSDGDSGV